MLAVVLIILVGKSLAAFLIVVAFRYPLHTALTISASLAQIGEFSFILAALSADLGLLPREAQSLVVAGALLSITLNPVIFATIGPVERWVKARPRLSKLLERERLVHEEPEDLAAQGMGGHVVLVGHGRVGSRLAGALGSRRIPYVVVEEDRDIARTLRAGGVPAIYGDAARPGVLEHARLAKARLLVVTAPDPFQARAIIENARRIHADIDIAARTHSDAERLHLESLRVGRVVMGERELADALTRYALEKFSLIEAEMEIIPPAGA